MLPEKLWYLDVCPPSGTIVRDQDGELALACGFFGCVTLDDCQKGVTSSFCDKTFITRFGYRLFAAVAEVEGCTLELAKVPFYKPITAVVAYEHGVLSEAELVAAYNPNILQDAKEFRSWHTAHRTPDLYFELRKLQPRGKFELR